MKKIDETYSLQNKHLAVSSIPSICLLRTPPVCSYGRGDPYSLLKRCIMNPIPVLFFSKYTFSKIIHRPKIWQQKSFCERVKRASKKFEVVLYSIRDENGYILFLYFLTKCFRWAAWNRLAGRSLRTGGLRSQMSVQRCQDLALVKRLSQEPFVIFPPRSYFSRQRVVNWDLVSEIWYDLMQFLWLPKKLRWCPNLMMWTYHWTLQEQEYIQKAKDALVQLQGILDNTEIWKKECSEGDATVYCGTYPGITQRLYKLDVSLDL